MDALDVYRGGGRMRPPLREFSRVRWNQDLNVSGAKAGMLRWCGDAGDELCDVAEERELRGQIHEAGSMARLARAQRSMLPKA